MSFAIITDSTSDISPARAQELGIYVIPLHVIIEGEDLLDQVQITAEEYVARMAGSEQLPHTSQPSAGEFKALFDRVRADGHDSAIFISLCSEWSACYANASLTAETHELDVRCIDSRTGSGAEGLLVEYARAMREDGRSLDETEAQIRATLPDAHLLLIPRTLENLVKNGRAPKLAGQLTHMLNIRLAVSPEWQSGEIKAIKKGPRRQAHRRQHHGRLPHVFGRAPGLKRARAHDRRRRGAGTCQRGARGPGLRRRRHRPHRLHHRHPRRRRCHRHQLLPPLPANSLGTPTSVAVK